MASMPFPHFPPKADWNLVRKLAEEDHIPLRELATRFGVSKGAVEHHARRDGWNTNQVRNAKRSLLKAMDGHRVHNGAGSLLTVRSPQAALLQLKAADTSTRLNLSTVIQRVARQLASLPEDKLLKGDNAKWLKLAIDGGNVLFGWNGVKRSSNGGPEADPFALTPDQLAKLAAKEIDATPAEPEKLD
jgi:hypothetical protein